MWALVAALWLAAGPSWAQVTGGTIAGVARDPMGGLVLGAAVTVTAVSTHVVRTSTTDAEGRFSVVGLPPDAYEVRVAAEGLRPLVRTGLHVSSGETIWLEVSLAIEVGETALTVTGDEPLMRRERSGLGQVIDARKASDLPLNGRSFITLAGLVPSVALPPGSLLPRINGGRPRTNEYLFDGISVLQPEPGQVAFQPNIDAIQELRIETNSPPAEYGRFNGGVVNLTTKSGGNTLRGSLFGFARHEGLNARNAFAPADAEKPVFRRGQFGGVAGGPLRRDRTFYFADYQGQRQRIGRTVISTVPTALQRQGVFIEAVGGRVPLIYDPATTTSHPSNGLTRTTFPNNTIPLDRVDPVARALLGRFPQPTSAGTANNYRRVDDEVVDQDQIGVRLDHRLSSRDLVFGRFTRFAEAFVPVAPLPDGSGVASGTSGPQRTTSWALASRYLRTFSDRVLHELRVGDTRRGVFRSAVRLPSEAEAALGLPGIPSVGQFADTLPTFLIAGYQQLGSPPNTAARFGTSVTQVANTLTWLRGRHTVKAGADLRWSRLNVVQPPSPTGVFTFTTLFTDLPGVAGTGTPLASFLLGQVQHFSIDLQRDQIRHRAHVQEYFVQDDWRVSDRLTVNAGLRYTLNFPSVEAQDRGAVFDLATERLEFLGRDGRPRSARRLHGWDIGPRLGLAVRATARTLARAGYGRVFIEQAGITTPFTVPVFPFVQTVSQRTLDNIEPAFTLAGGPSVEPVPLSATAGLGQGVFAVDRHLGSGYVQQWHVSLQRGLAANIAVEAGYVGSHVSRVGLPDANQNQLTARQLAQGAALLQRVPNPYFGVIPRSSSLGDETIPLAQLLKPYPQYTTVSLYRHNVGTSAYHGAFVKLEQRVFKGLSTVASYTRSTLVDDASSVFDASILTGPVANAPVADSFNRRLDRDRSTGDIPHVFVGSVVWDVPFGPGRARQLSGWRGALLNGWTLTGVVTHQSGVPLAVTQLTNQNAFAGFGTQRPNLVGDPNLPPSARSVRRWFNTAAFEAAPAFAIGTSSRNPVRGPGYRNLDVALIRRVPVAGDRALEWRAEVFNATNTPAWGAPNTVVGSAGFGTITTAGDPRVVQIAVKFLF